MIPYLDPRMSRRPGSPGALVSQGQGLLAQIRSRLSRPGLSGMLTPGAAPAPMGPPSGPSPGPAPGPRPGPGPMLGAALRPPAAAPAPMGAAPPMAAPAPGPGSVSQIFQSPEFLGAAPALQQAIQRILLGETPQPPAPRPAMPTGPARLLGAAGRPGLMAARPGLSQFLGGGEM